MTHLAPEPTVRDEFEAALREHHPAADWVEDVAAQLVWSGRTVTDLVALVDEGERVVKLWHIKGKCYAIGIDPAAFARVTIEDVDRFSAHLREEIPDLLDELGDRVDWIHPDYRELPYKASYHRRGEPHPVFGRE